MIDVSDGERAQAFENIKTAATTTALSCPNRSARSVVALQRLAARPPIGGARHGRLPIRARADSQGVTQISIGPPADASVKDALLLLLHPAIMRSDQGWQIIATCHATSRCYAESTSAPTVASR